MMIRNFPSSSFIRHLVFICIYLIGLIPLLVNAVWKSENYYGHFIIIIRILCCIILIRLIKSEIWFLYLTSTLPGPRSSVGEWPLVGQFFTTMKDPQQFHHYNIQTIGSTYTINQFYKPTVCFTEDEDVKWLYKQERQGKTIPKGIPHIRKLLGEKSILLSHGSYHRRLRKLMDPAFTSTAISSYLPIMDRCIQETLHDWSQRDDSSIPLTIDDCKSLSLKILFLCILPELDPTTLDELRINCVIWFNNFGAIIPYRIPGTNMYKSWKGRDKMIQILNQTVDTFQAKYDEDSIEAKTSVLGRLCYTQNEDGIPLTRDELLQNLLILILAGHETTAGSIAGLLYRLSNLKHVCLELETEILNIMQMISTSTTTTTTTTKENQKKNVMKGDENNNNNNNIIDNDDDDSSSRILYEKLKDAPILNAILAEFWRMDPPVSRHTTDVQERIEYKGHTYRPGVKMSFLIQDSIQSQPERYPDSNEFRIERFLPKNHPYLLSKSLGGNKNDEDDDQQQRQQQQKYYTGIDYNTFSVQYRTFGGGQHTCLGHNFARLEPRLFLTRLFQHYTFQVDSATLVTIPLRSWSPKFHISPKTKEEG